MSKSIRSKKIYDQLIEIAGEDGVFTIDELVLIKNIISKFGEYEKILEEALDDGKITGNERLILFHSRMALTQSVLGTAYEDEKITKDEFALLTKFQKILDEIDIGTLQHI